MWNTEKFTLKRIFIFIITSLFPSFPLIMSIYSMVDGVIYTLPYALAYTILPLTTIVVLYLIIFSELLTGTKKILTTLTVIAFGVIFFFAQLYSGVEYLTKLKEEKAWTAYNSSLYFDFQPKQTDLGEPESFEYYIYNAAGAIYEIHAGTAIARYDESQYQEQNQRIDSTYNFATSESKWTPYKETSIGQYRFRLLTEQEGISYPKNMYIIGTNDHTKEIVYIRFVDVDLDYITSMEDFINNECGWKYIR